MKRYTITYKREPMDFYRLHIVNFSDNMHKNSKMRRVTISASAWMLEPLLTTQFLQRLCSHESKYNPAECVERELEIMQEMLDYASGCDEVYQYDFKSWWKKNGFEQRYNELKG